MKKSGILSLALAFCALFSLLLFVSCSRDGEKITEPARDEDSLVICGGQEDYTLLLKREQSDGYKECVDLLLASFEEQFGIRLRTRILTEDTELDESSKVILFGDLGTDHPAEDYAKGIIDGPGFSVCAVGETLALYADSDSRLADLTELFAEKYVKNEKGRMLIDRDIYLMRQFDPYTGGGFEDIDPALPVVEIKTSTGRQITSKEKYIRSSISVSNVYMEYSLHKESAQVKGRGNGSWKYSGDNKPLRIKFDQKQNLLGAGGGSSRDWELLSNPFDYTQLRNAVAFTLGREVFKGVGYTTDFRYAHVFVCGVYKGIYLVCDRMEISSHKIDIDEDPENVKSDYLIQLDSYAHYGEAGEITEGVDFFRMEDKCWVIESDYNSAERCEHVRRRFEIIFSAIRSGDPEKIAKYVDLESCVDMYLLHEYCKNTDAGWSSFYVVLTKDSKLYFTAPWDFDLSSGNDIRVDNGSYEGIHAGELDDPALSNPIFYLLTEQDFFKRLVCERWSELSRDAFDTALSLIDTYSGEYRGEFIYDCMKNYPAESVHKFSDADDGETVYTDNLKYLRSWYINRTKWMNGYFSQLPKEGI